MRLLAFPLCAALARLAASEPVAATHHATSDAPPDSIARAAVIDEVGAFYRDLDAGRWSALLDHFLPAKVTARWAPPAASGEWAGLEAPAPPADGAAAPCPPRVAVAVVGDWARVRVRRCAWPVDEAWLLRVSGRWKIVHLVLAHPSDLHRQLTRP